MDIESYYCIAATGDLLKAQEVNELRAQIYPRSWVPHNDLGIIAQGLGTIVKAVAEYRKGLKLDPESTLLYGNLLIAYLGANEMVEAKELVAEAQEKKLDSPDLLAHSTIRFPAG